MPMISLQGVRVEIVSDGRILDLFDDPDASDENVDPYSRALYVEAKQGAKFSVRVILTKDFQYLGLGDNDAVELTLPYDGSGGTSILMSGRDCRRRSMGGRLDVAETFARSWSFCRTSQQWSAGDTCFGDLIIDDTNAAASAEQISKLGSLQIKVQRVTRRRLAVAKPCGPPVDAPIQRLSEKMVKGKSITSVVKSVNTIAGIPPPNKWKTSRLNGQAGKALNYTIYYRSRETLRCLGCIPSSPPPEAEPHEEIHRLQERIAFLERTRPLKTEPSGLVHGVKRELQDNRTSNDAKRIRSARIEVVDLTGDS